jgi:hypothetical protein
MGFYVPEDDILDSHRREHLKSYIGAGGTRVQILYIITLVTQHHISIMLEGMCVGYQQNAQDSRCAA